jgi:hypothetical protein
MFAKAGKVQLLNAVEVETNVEKRSGSLFSVLISAVTVRKDADYFRIPLVVRRALRDGGQAQASFEMCNIQVSSFYTSIPVRSLVKSIHVILEFQYLLVPTLHGGRFNFLRGFGGKAVSPVIGDCLIDDCSAVDTFPGIKDQEEVREPFHHHQSFALRTIHNNFPLVM